MNREYVFLVGAPRSGTTWLQIMLARHPDLSTCQETHLFSSFLSSMQQHWRQFAKSNRGAGLQAAISHGKFIELERHFALSVLDSIGDAPIILEKTPAHVTVLSDIMEVLPEARFIHIIRDPRSVAASLAAAGKDWGHSWASTDSMRNARRWMNCVTAGIALRDRPSIYCEVRYEDLLTDAAAELERIFTWIGVDSIDDFCNRVAEESRFDKIQKSASHTAWNLSSEPKGFFRKGQADGWKEDLILRDIAVVESIAAPLMERLGYERVTSGLSWLQTFGIRARAGAAWRLDHLVQKLH
jgi:hypothetical protein